MFFPLRIRTSKNRRTVIDSSRIFPRENDTESILTLVVVTGDDISVSRPFSQTTSNTE